MASVLELALCISEISRHTQWGVFLAAWQVSMQISSPRGLLMCLYLAPHDHPRYFTFAVGSACGNPNLCQGLILLFGSWVLPERPTWLAKRRTHPASYRKVKSAIKLSLAGKEQKLCVPCQKLLHRNLPPTHSQRIASWRRMDDG